MATAAGLKISDLILSKLRQNGGILPENPENSSNSSSKKTSRLSFSVDSLLNKKKQDLDGSETKSVPNDNAGDKNEISEEDEDIDIQNESEITTELSGEEENNSDIAEDLSTSTNNNMPKLVVPTPILPPGLGVGGQLTPPGLTPFLRPPPHLLAVMAAAAAAANASTSSTSTSPSTPTTVTSPSGALPLGGTLGSPLGAGPPSGVHPTPPMGFPFGIPGLRHPLFSTG